MLRFSYTKEKNKFIIVKQSRFSYTVTYVLITTDGKSINILDKNYIPKVDDFEIYERAAGLNKLTSANVDFLLDTECDDIPSAVNAIDTVAIYAANQGYNVQKLIGSAATTGAIKSAINNNDLVAMGNIGHGSPTGILLDNGSISHSWFAAQDLRGEIYYFNSCRVYNEPFVSSMLNSGDARTYIGGVLNLPIGTSEEVFKDFWDYTLNSDWQMGSALGQGETNNNLQNYHNIGGDDGIIELTTSGTLNRNEVWLGGVSIAGNVYIPTSKTLTFKTGATINLNGHYIKSTGGTILVDIGANVNGYKAIVTQSGSIKGYYPTFATALSHATSGQTVELHSSTTLSGNLIIPSGANVKIKANRTLTLNGYYLFGSNSSITQESGVTIIGLQSYVKYYSTTKGYFPSVQTAINNASGFQSVELLSSTYNESFGFTSRSDIKLVGQGQGATTINSSFSVTNSDDIWIQNMSINPNVNINSSHNTKFQNVLFNAATIVNDYGGTSTDVSACSAADGGASFAYRSYGGEGDAYSSEISGFDVAFYLVEGADYNIGTNNTFCNNGLDIYAYGGGAYAYVISNDYTRNVNDAVYGNVFITGINGICPRQSRSVQLELASLSKPTGGVTGSFAQIRDAFSSLKQLMYEDKENGNVRIEYYNSVVNDLSSELKNSLANLQHKKEMKEGLTLLKHIYYSVDRKEDFRNCVQQLSGNKKYDKFTNYIDRYSIWNLVDNGHYNGAAKLAKEIRNKSKDDNSLLIEMIYEEALINKYYLNDLKEAEKLFNEIAANYQDNILSEFALAELGIEQDTSPKNNIVDDEEIEFSYELRSHPNPFNPSTTISYSIPQKGHVVLKVYDILGREVYQLVNEAKEAGIYSAQFDGSKLASGMYIISLQTNEFNNSIKILLIK